MSMHLVLDIGNQRIKGGLFQEKTLVDAFRLPAHPLPKEELMRRLANRPITHVLISSVNAKAEEDVKRSLEEQKIAYAFLDPANLKLQLDVDEPLQLGHDRIANAYGALCRFPTNDTLVVDIGTAITYDLVAKEGRYLGGMIYPGAELCAKALHTFTDKLPTVTPKKPPSALGKTTETHIQGGIYWGQLGAIERTIAELRLTAASPSSVKVIATGGATQKENTEFVSDLNELVDLIDPYLTLLGLNEILIERIQ